MQYSAIEIILRVQKHLHFFLKEKLLGKKIFKKAEAPVVASWNVPREIFK